MDIVDVVYPKKCFGCGAVGDYVCDECVGDIGVSLQICPVCGGFSSGGWRHVRCGGDVELDRLVVGLKYRGIVSSLLKRVKFGSSWDVLERLFDVWWDRVGEVFDSVDFDGWVVSWVPMYRMKYIKRGFNQAEVFASMLGERLGLDVIRLLVRSRNTKPQFGLSRGERVLNVKGVFELDEGVGGVFSGCDGDGSDEYAGVSGVLLVDDIWTTGSTMRECVRVLKSVRDFGRGCVERVWGVVMSGR